MYIFIYIFFVCVCYSISVTVGPPENVWVTPGEGSLVIRFSSPFDISPSSATFLYYVHYWEKGGIQKARAFFSTLFCFSFLWFSERKCTWHWMRRTEHPSVALESGPWTTFHPSPGHPSLCSLCGASPSARWIWRPLPAWQHPSPTVWDAHGTPVAL